MNKLGLIRSDDLIVILDGFCEHVLTEFLLWGCGGWGRERERERERVRREREIDR